MSCAACHTWFRKKNHISSQHENHIQNNPCEILFIMSYDMIFTYMRIEIERRFCLNFDI